MAATSLPQGSAWVIAVGVGYLGWAADARSIPVAIIAVGILTVGCGVAALGGSVTAIRGSVGGLMLLSAVALRLGPEAT